MDESEITFKTHIERQCRRGQWTVRLEVCVDGVIEVYTLIFPRFKEIDEIKSCIRLQKQVIRKEYKAKTTDTNGVNEE